MSTEIKSKSDHSHMPRNNRRGTAEAAARHALEQK